MNKWTENLDRLHKPFDIAFFRTLSLLLGLYHVGLLMWDPIQYADSIGGFNVTIAPLFIWAVCASAVFSIGFKPKPLFWKLLFSPIVSLGLLSYFSVIHLI